MPSVSLQKQGGSRYWYAVWWDPRKKKNVWRSTRLEDRNQAEMVRAEMEARLNGAAREDTVRRVLEEVGKEEVEAVRVPLAGVWGLYEKMPKPRRCRERTENSKRNNVSRFLRWTGERHPEIQGLQQVTPRVCVEFFGELADDGLSGQSLNNIRSDLKSVWKVIGVRCGVDRNPWDSVNRVEAQNCSYRPLEKDEVCRLYEAAVAHREEMHEPTFWPAAVALAWHGGLRLGDIATLEWDEVVSDAEFIRLVPNKGWRKNRQQSYLRHDDWMQWVERSPTADVMAGYVWPVVAQGYKVARWLHEELVKLWRFSEIEVEVEVPGRLRPKKLVTFHSLRHSFCTGLIESGESLENVQVAAGHSTCAMTMNYVHHADRVARELASKRESLMG